MKRIPALIILTSTMLAGLALCQAQEEPEKIAYGFQFVEGPVWVDGIGLLFSDIPANTVYKWTADSGAKIYYTSSGNSNGLALDLQGNLLLAQHGKRRVAKLDSKGNETVLADLYEDKKLNSPNDMAVKSDGSVFFTDPPYGLLSGQTSELGYCGIFRISPSGKLYLLDNTLSRPNGIAFSPDESKLYVSDSETRRIYVWNVVSDTVIAKKTLFASMEPPGYADGLKTDADGRLFATGPIGVWVYDTSGAPLDTIPVPGQTTNCAWGDEDRNTLYITSGTEVYRVRNKSAAIPQPDQGRLKD